LTKGALSVIIANGLFTFGRKIFLVVNFDQDRFLEILNFKFFLKIFSLDPQGLKIFKVNLPVTKPMSHKYIQNFREMFRLSPNL
jgi:hypothetical protein